MNKEVCIVAGVILGLLILFAVSLIFALCMGPLWFILPALLGGTLLYLLFGGLVNVPPEKRLVVQILGRFYGILPPGLQWVCPFFMERRAEVSIWEQSIKLFPDVIKIDFPDGSAILKGVTAFLRVKDPDISYEVSIFPSSTGKPETGVYRVIYEVDNWRERGRELLENAVRSYLGGLGLDDALRDGKGGYNLLDGKIPPDEVNGIKEKLASWGLELTKLTIEDFDLDPKVIAAREAVQEAKRKADAAEANILTRSRETVGALVRMMADAIGEETEDIQREIAASSEVRENFNRLAQELIIRQMSIDAGCLTDVRVGGSKDGQEDYLKKFFLEMMTAWKSLSSSKSEPSSKSEE
jgi:regulator of protease activity HflC (stomatin/prohibitin superfamily)